MLQGRNYSPHRPRNAGSVGGCSGASNGTLCRLEKEILALGPKMSPGQGAHMVFSAGGPEFEVTPLLCFHVAATCFYVALSRTEQTAMAEGGKSSEYVSGDGGQISGGGANLRARRRIMYFIVLRWIFLYLKHRNFVDSYTDYQRCLKMCIFIGFFALEKYILWTTVTMSYHILVI